jgi:hypothetical protein
MTRRKGEITLPEIKRKWPYQTLSADVARDSYSASWQAI